MSETESKRLDLSFLPRSLIAWCICAAALLLSAAGLYSLDGVSLSSLGYCSSIISFLAAVCAGAAAAATSPGGRIQKALLAALCLSILLFLTGFLIKGRLEGSAVLSVASFTLAGCVLGAFLPAKRKKRSRFRVK